MSYSLPKLFNRYDSRSLRFWKQIYASKGNQSYLILRHNISIRFNSGEYVERKKKYKSFSSHSFIFAVNLLDLWIGELSNITMVFFVILCINLSIIPISLSELNVVSLISKKGSFLRFIKPKTFKNVPLAAGNNIGLSFVCHAYGTFGVSPKCLSSPK